jgi:Pro-kumamolisin, activation domain
MGRRTGGDSNLAPHILGPSGPRDRCLRASFWIAGERQRIRRAHADPTAPTTIPAARQILPGHKIPSLAHVAALGPTDVTRELQLTISLAPRNPQQLDRLLQEQNDPRSPEYRKYLTPAQFTAQFGPTQASVHAPVTEPSVPVALAGVMQGVFGLDDAVQMRPLLQRSTLGPQAGSGPLGGYTSADLNTAYDATPLPSGNGQSIALVELDGYNPTDIATFATQYGLGSISLSNRFVDSATNVTGQGAGEVELDIEVVADIAPAAVQHVYIGPDTSLQTSVDVYNAIVTDDLASVVSSSWGICEQLPPLLYFQLTHAILSEAAAQGQAVFVASGDSGAYSCNDLVAGDPLGVVYPASDPLAIGVGGTTLSTGLGGQYGSESAWGCSFCAGNAPHGTGGGGGISILFPRPTYQTGAGVINQFSNGNREVPDVSADADLFTGYSVYCTVAAAGCDPFQGWTVFWWHQRRGPTVGRHCGRHQPVPGCPGQAWLRQRQRRTVPTLQHRAAISSVSRHHRRQ